MPWGLGRMNLGCNLRTMHLGDASGVASAKDTSGYLASEEHAFVEHASGEGE